MHYPITIHVQCVLKLSIIVFKHAGYIDLPSSRIQKDVPNSKIISSFQSSSHHDHWTKATATDTLPWRKSGHILKQGTT